MKTLKIYDPAMCCPTGVCGTSVDTKLVQLSNFINSLDKKMFEVKRFGLSTNPQEYVINSKVSELLNKVFVIKIKRKEYENFKNI